MKLIKFENIPNGVGYDDKHLIVFGFLKNEKSIDGFYILINCFKKYNKDISLNNMVRLHNGFYRYFIQIKNFKINFKKAFYLSEWLNKNSLK